MSAESVPITNQPLRKLKRVEYEKLAAQGVFEHERVELIFGMVVAMSPIDPAHGTSTARINRMLTLALHDRAEIRCQVSFAATDDSEPEPDIYVTPLGDYWREHPSRAYLVVEVANTSLRYDCGEKALLYSISQVDEYWIVDLVNGLVEVRRERDRGTWRSVTTYRRGDTVHMIAFPDVGISVSEILPPV